MSTIRLIPEDCRSNPSWNNPEVLALESAFQDQLHKVIQEIFNADTLKDLWAQYRRRLSEYHADREWFSRYSKETVKLDKSIRATQASLRAIDLLEQENSRLRPAHLQRASDETLATLLDWSKSTNKLIDGMSLLVQARTKQVSESYSATARKMEWKLFWFRVRSQYLRFIEETIYGLLLLTFIVNWIRGALFSGPYAIAVLGLLYFLKKYWLNKLIAKMILRKEKARLAAGMHLLHIVLFCNEASIRLWHDQVLKLRNRIRTTGEQDSSFDLGHPGNLHPPASRD